MALNIKNTEVERLAAEVARLTGESKTEAIKTALSEKRERLTSQSEHARRVDRAFAYLEKEVWPNLPPGVRGKRLTRQEREDILGIGPEGV
ncbi:MAG: type II toxin-antitoxin system VapB family antitoxin [Fimbriimonadales bacterium]